MNFLTEILAHKQLEVEKLTLENAVSPRSIRPSLAQMILDAPDHVHLIGEIKRASPSKGMINEQVDLGTQVARYEQAGVSAISVLTDPTFFKGSIEDLKTVASATSLPLLCKDFIIDEKQIIRAKQAGASIILLIVACLTPAHLTHLFTFACAQGLEVLVETHDLNELTCAQALGATLIGVNNRDLETFDVSLTVSEQVASYKQDHLLISESGFKTAADVKRVATAYDAVLVGETLMQSTDIVATAQALQVVK